MARLGWIVGISVLCTFLAVSCATPKPFAYNGNFIYFDGGKSSVDSDRKPASVKVGAPSRKHQVVGIVEAIGGGPKVKVSHVVPELKRMAAAMNADGIYQIQSKKFNHAGDSIYVFAKAYRYR